jgi:hypothetical protein
MNSGVTTSVLGGTGNGGNIVIDPQFIVLNASTISANAVGGNGGNISILGGNLVMTPDSAITASSALGVSGTISTPPPDATVGQQLVILPANFFDVSAKLRVACAARGAAADASTLVGVGRGGMPAGPDSALLAAVRHSKTSELPAGSSAVSAKLSGTEIQIAGLGRLELANGRLICEP